MHIFSKADAIELAKHDRAYVVRPIGNDRYIVWDCKSDHRVEFNATCPHARDACARHDLAIRVNGHSDIV